MPDCGTNIEDLTRITDLPAGTGDLIIQTSGGTRIISVEDVIKSIGDKIPAYANPAAAVTDGKTTGQLCKASGTSGFAPAGTLFVLL